VKKTTGRLAVAARFDLGTKVIIDITRQPTEWIGACCGQQTEGKELPTFWLYLAASSGRMCDVAAALLRQETGSE